MALDTKAGIIADITARKRVFPSGVWAEGNGGREQPGTMNRTALLEEVLDLCQAIAFVAAHPSIVEDLIRDVRAGKMMLPLSYVVSDSGKVQPTAQYERAAVLPMHLAALVQRTAALVADTVGGSDANDAFTAALALTDRISGQQGAGILSSDKPVSGSTSMREARPLLLDVLAQIAGALP